MGGSLKPKTDDPEFTNTPRREFNLSLIRRLRMLC